MTCADRDDNSSDYYYTSTCWPATRVFGKIIQDLGRIIPLSVQHPKSVTMLGWGLRLFMTCSSLSRSCLSLSPADSFSVLTATNDEPSRPAVDKIPVIYIAHCQRRADQLLAERKEIYLRCSVLGISKPGRSSLHPRY